MKAALTLRISPFCFLGGEGGSHMTAPWGTPFPMACWGGVWWGRWVSLASRLWLEPSLREGLYTLPGSSAGDQPPLRSSRALGPWPLLGRTALQPAQLGAALQGGECEVGTEPLCSSNNGPLMRELCPAWPPPLDSGDWKGLQPPRQPFLGVRLTRMP